MLRETSSWDTLPLSSSWLIWSKLLRGSSRRSLVFQRCLGTSALPALLHMEGSQGWNTQWCLLNRGKQQASDWHKVSCGYLRSMRQDQSPWKREHKLGDVFLLILPLVLQNTGIFSNSDHVCYIFAIHRGSQLSILPIHCCEWVLGCLFTPSHTLSGAPPWAHFFMPYKYWGKVVCKMVCSRLSCWKGCFALHTVCLL